MKINESVKNTPGVGVDKSGVEKAGSAKVEANAKSQVAQSQQSGAAAENVTLSPLSAQIKSLEAKVSTASVFDAEKVEAIKSAIASGKFQVDSDKVANGLIETVKDLLTTKFA